MARRTLPHELQKLEGPLLASAINATVAPLVLVDNLSPDRPIIYANQAFLDMSGYNRLEVTGKNCRLLQGPKTSQVVIRQIRHALDAGRPVKVTINNYRKDGREFWNELSIQPLRNAAGEVSHFLGMQADVTSRVEHIQLMEADQRQMLTSLQSAKDEFIALSSHQLRTPATAVKQYLSMILDGYAGKVPLSMEHFLQTAYDSNERQLKIIDSILQTAQLDTGERHLVKQPENVGVLVAEVVSDFASIINIRHQTIELTLGEGSIAPIDSTELRIAFANLLENASRYSPEGATIEVVVRRTNRSVVVAFKDHGVGIEPKDHKWIFDKFTRVDNVLSDTVSGNGLGLYFVRRIVKMHGAQLRLRSTLGKGSCFSVILPI